MQTPEFTRPIGVESLGDGATRRTTIQASGEECAALARRFGIAAVESLEAGVALTRRGRQVRAVFDLACRVVQTCVVTLEPLPSSLEESFSLVFDPDVRRSGEFDELPGVFDDDPPEPLRDETIDAGETAAGLVGLILDPWPRKPGAEVDPRYTAGGGLAPSPFAALETLRRRD